MMDSRWQSYGVTTFGGYTGPTVNIRAMDPLYIGVGAVAELGLGYGVTGYGSLPTTTAPNPSVNFGSAFTWDFSVGARWP